MKKYEIIYDLGNTINLKTIVKANDTVEALTIFFETIPAAVYHSITEVDSDETV